MQILQVSGESMPSVTRHGSVKGAAAADNKPQTPPRISRYICR